MLEVDIDENNKEIYDVDKEINRTQKTKRKRKQEHRKYRDVCFRLSELKKSRTNLKSEIEALNQIISHIEEVKDAVKFSLKK